MGWFPTEKTVVGSPRAREIFSGVAPKTVESGQAEHGPACTCPRCGRPAAEPPLDFAYRMPDCVFARPEEQRSPRCNEDFADLDSGRFVRALLPVPIEGGEEFCFGIWVEVSVTTFERVVRAWNESEAYRTLSFDGAIANAFPPSVGGPQGCV